MNNWRTEDIKSIIRSLSETMENNRDYLITLDSAMGDGDLGITMSNAFHAADHEAQKLDEAEPGKLLARLGVIIAKAAPSTMGTLIATGFMRGGKVIGPVHEIGLLEISTFIEAFTNGIMERGKAKPGDKTIIDVLFPASQALLEAVQKNKSLHDGLLDAYRAAQIGLDDSKKMKAQFGRAAYYQEGSIGKQDGGATVGFLIIEEFYKYSMQSFYTKTE